MVKVSVLMAVHNGRGHLKEAIKSILSQTFNDFEFIIIDDKSTDDSLKVIKSFKDKRIRLVTNKKNLGLAKSLNKGLSLARGEYIARMDADDISLPDRLEVQASFLDSNPSVALVGSYAIEIDNNGKPLVNHNGIFRKNMVSFSSLPSTPEEIKKSALSFNPIIHPSIMVRTNVIKKLLYDESFEAAQDYDLILRLLLSYKVANITKPLIKYRRSYGISYSRMKTQERHALRARFRYLKATNRKFSFRLLKPLISFLVPSSLKLWLIRRCKRPLVLCIFMTYNTGFCDWERSGIIDRQKKIYSEYLKSVAEIIFISYDNAPYDFIPGTKVLHKGPLPPSLFSMLSPFLFFRRLRKSSLITTVQMPGAWSAAISSILSSRPFILRQGWSWSATERVGGSRLKFFIERILEFFTLLVAKRVIVTANDQKNDLMRLNFLRRPFFVIPNGVDTGLFRPIKAPKSKNSLLFVGRLNEIKNLDSLISACKGLNCRLTIVGCGSLKTSLEQLASRKGVTVNFLGRVPNHKLPEIMARHEIFVLPSFKEGSPKVLLEALSAGMAVIGSDVSGINNVVTHGVNGLLCKTDPESIRETLIFALSNRKLLKRLRVNARKTAINGYSLESCIKKELEVYFGRVS